MIKTKVAISGDNCCDKCKFAGTLPGECFYTRETGEVCRWGEGFEKKEEDE